MKRAKVCAATLATLICLVASTQSVYGQPAVPPPYYAGPAGPAPEQAQGPVFAPQGPYSGGYGENRGGGGLFQGATIPLVPGNFSGQAIYLYRQMPTQHALVNEIPPGHDLIDIRDLDPGLGAGMGFTGVLHPGWADIEVNFFALDSWGHQLQAVAPGSSGIVLPDLDPTNVYSAAQTYFFSKLYNGEVNWRCPLGTNFTALVGFRYAELSEELGVAGQQNIYDISGDLIETDTTWAKSKITNDLYGIQIGGAYAWGKGTSPLYLDAGIKGAVCTNQIHRERFTGSNLASPPTDIAYTQDSAGVPAFVGEVSARVTWEFSPNFSIFGGYQVLWLSGVAVASDHLATDTVSSISATECLLFHGASLGLEAHW